MQITIIGKASGKEYPIDYTKADYDRNLMFFIRAHDITVASSCDGEGVCLKCVIQNDWPSCQLTLQEFLERQPDGKIYISYL